MARGSAQAAPIDPMQATGEQTDQPLSSQGRRGESKLIWKHYQFFQELVSRNSTARTAYGRL